MIDTNEIYHHGVSGMKWGKHNGPPYPLDAQGKAALKQQKRKFKDLSYNEKEDYKSHKTYNKIRAHKAVKRDVAIATLGGAAVGFATGGPVGALGTMLGSSLATTAVSSAVNAGRNAVSNSKYKKMLLNSSEFQDAVKKGNNVLKQASEAKSEKRQAAIKNVDSSYKKSKAYAEASPKFKNDIDSTIRNEAFRKYCVDVLDVVPENIFKDTSHDALDTFMNMRNDFEERKK